MNHDIVVIGASAGGVDALKAVLSGLPRDLPASVFVTIHTSSDAPGYLADILGRVCPLPVVYAGLREEIQKGRVYLSRSNLHLIVKRGQVQSRFLAKENGTRPAIDPMFRSAAHSYGRRVIGVILTGNLDDGVAGLGIIKDEGGIVVIQDPRDAQFDNMPVTALKFVRSDYVVPLADMARLLVDLVHTEVKGEAIEEKDEPKESSQVLTCPGCGGVLREYINENGVWYQCQVGHRYTPEAMMKEQNVHIEEQLWSTIALLRQKAETNRAMAADERSSRKGSTTDVEYYEEQARAAQEAVETLEHLLEKKGDALFPGPPKKSVERLEKTRRRRQNGPEGQDSAGSAKVS